MECLNCGANTSGKFCEYCGTKLEASQPNENTQKQQGNWPVALLIEDEYIDEDTNAGTMDCFAYDIATESETDVVTGKENCLNELKQLIQEYIQDEEVSAPIEADIKKDTYIKKLTKKYKLQIVYLEI